MRVRIRSTMTKLECIDPHDNYLSPQEAQAISRRRDLMVLIQQASSSSSIISSSSILKNEPRPPVNNVVVGGMERSRARIPGSVNEEKKSEIYDVSNLVCNTPALIGLVEKPVRVKAFLRSRTQDSTSTGFKSDVSLANTTTLPVESSFRGSNPVQKQKLFLQQLYRLSRKHHNQFESLQETPSFTSQAIEQSLSSERQIESSKTVDKSSERRMESSPNLEKSSEHRVKNSRTLEKLSGHRAESSQTMEKSSDLPIRSLQTLDPSSQHRLDISQTLDPSSQLRLRSWQAKPPPHFRIRPRRTDTIARDFKHKVISVPSYLENEKAENILSQPIKLIMELSEWSNSLECNGFGRKLSNPLECNGFGRKLYFSTVGTCEKDCYESADDDGSITEYLYSDFDEHDQMQSQFTPASSIDIDEHIDKGYTSPLSLNNVILSSIEQYTDAATGAANVLLDTIDTWEDHESFMDEGTSLEGCSSFSTSLDSFTSLEEV